MSDDKDTLEIQRLRLLGQSDKFLDWFAAIMGWVRLARINPDYWEEAVFTILMTFAAFCLDEKDWGKELGGVSFALEEGYRGSLRKSFNYNERMYLTRLIRYWMREKPQKLGDQVFYHEWDRKTLDIFLAWLT